MYDTPVNRRYDKKLRKNSLDEVGLTQFRIYANASKTGCKKSSKVGRKKQFQTRITLPLSDEMAERIAATLRPDEVRLDFIREAIDRELKRRERAKDSTAKRPDSASDV